jgi:hypothetical protein
MGNEIGMAKWSGSGFWLDDRLLATNAHVALRGHRIVATADNGDKYHFDTIVGLDIAGDIAILRADRPGDKPGVDFVDKPSNPKDLRGREILMVGNSGALGLGVFDGRITNVLGEPNQELLLHTAAVVGGSSGSAVFDKQANKVVGIHHSANTALDARFATPSWRIEKVLAEARKKKGVAIDQLFTLQNLVQFVELWGERQFCISGGQAFTVPFVAKQASDFIISIRPTDPNAVYIAGLVSGQQVIWGQAFKGQSVLPFALPMFGPMELRIVAPNDAPAPVCAIVGAGDIVWEKGIQ